VRLEVDENTSVNEIKKQYATKTRLYSSRKIELIEVDKIELRKSHS
jgi:hypothetical protein